MIKNIKPRLMSWQAYRFFRFRQSRINLYGEKFRKLKFASRRSLVTLVCDVDKSHNDQVEQLLSKLSYTNLLIEVVFRFSGDEENKVFNEREKAGKREERFGTGEFIGFYTPGSITDFQLIERMVDQLKRNSDVDLIFTRSKIYSDPIGDLVIARNTLFWSLGEFPYRKDREEWLAYWQQASLLFRAMVVDEDGLKAGEPVDLAIELEAHSDEKEKNQFDFVRDHYLTPWVCLLDIDDEEFRSDFLLEKLVQAIQKTGNIIIKRGASFREILAEPWLPKIILSLVDNEAGSENIENKALRNINVRILAGIHNERENPARCFTINFGSKLDKPFVLVSEAREIAQLDEVALLNLIDIWIHAQYIRSFRQFVSKPLIESYKVSVVISTYRRPQVLKNSLESVIGQMFPAHDFEIIVVNNDPDEILSKHVVEEVGKIDGERDTATIRLLQCPIPGISFARNLGVMESRGEIICFLDDDAIASRTWLQQIWENFIKHPETGIIGGHIRLLPPYPKPRILMAGFERFWGQFITNYTGYAEVKNWTEFPWGANWCARRSVFLDVGGFRGQYGRTGKDFGGGEELISAMLIQKLGYAIAILPDALVDHSPDSSKYTFDYIRRTIIAQIISNYRFKSNGYLSEQPLISTDVIGLVRFIRKLGQLVRLPSERRSALAVEYFCYLNAWAYLFFLKLRDLLVRFWHRKYR